MHIAYEMASHIDYHLKSELSIMFHCQLCQPVTQHYESRAFRKAPLQSMHNRILKERNSAVHPSLSSEK